MCVSAPHPVLHLEGKHILGGNFSLSKALKSCAGNSRSYGKAGVRGAGLSSSPITCGEAANLTPRAPPRTPHVCSLRPRASPTEQPGDLCKAGRQPRSQPLCVALQPP